MSNQSYQAQQEGAYMQGRGRAVTFGGVVYVGVVLAASTLFINFVLSAFPEKAYFSRFVMAGAGVVIGLSALAFPYALHNWAIAGFHRKVTTGLYFGELGIIAINTLVSFGALLAKYSGYDLPEWIQLFEPFTILGMVYTLAAWGIVFLTDPMAKAKAKELQAEQTFRARIADKRLEYLDSIEGEETIIQIAEADIAEQFNPERYTKTAKHFGRARAGQESGLFSKIKQLGAETPSPFGRDDNPKG